MELVKIPMSLLRNRQRPECPLFDDEATLKLYGWIVGGAARRYFLGQEQDSDIDIAPFGDGSLESLCVYYRDQQKYKQTKSREGLIELQKDNLTIQLLSFIPDPTIEKLFESFDFTICQFAIDYASDTLIATHEAMIDAARSRLVINKITYPVASLFRIQKYQAQGYKMCAGSARKFIEEVRGLEDPFLETVYID